MFNHFDQHLNVRELILEHRPWIVVECGAGGGNHTQKLLKLQDEVPFMLVVINDSDPGLASTAHLHWIRGVSYVELERIPSGYDFCIIDTDHNYWTLRKELEVCKRRMRPGGIVCLHDTETFATTDGVMGGYGMKYLPYPHEEIASAGKHGLRPAIDEALEDGWELLRETKESCGAMAIRKIKY